MQLALHHFCTSSKFSDVWRYWPDQNLLVAPSSEGGETMGNRPVIEVTTGLAGEFLGLRYKSGCVVPRGGHRQRERNGTG
jgi:hypothetical protein